MLFKFFLLLFTGIILIFFQVHPFLPFGKTGIRPDLLLILVIYLGLNHSQAGGAFLCCVFGFFIEVFSGANSGLYVMIYLCVFEAIKFLQRFLSFETMLEYFFLFLIGAFCKYAILLFSFYFVYEYQYLLSGVLFLKDSLFTLILFPIIFCLINRLFNAKPKTSIF